MNEIQNANPTILNLSELPTRRNKQSVKNAKSEMDALVWRPENMSALFGHTTFADDDLTSEYEPIDEQEIYDLISSICDPEHPLSLGQLSVVNLPDIHIDPPPSASRPYDSNTLTQVLVKITPTITHCSLATIIGLGIRVRLEQALPPNFRVDIVIKDGTHNQADQVNKQLADRERVAAAMENDTLKGVINKMLETCDSP